MSRIRIRQGVICLLAGLCFGLSLPQEASSTSSYQDFNRTAYFLITPPQLSLEGRAARTSASDSEAAIYTLGALMPFRLFLFQLEVPYVSLAQDGDLLDGFGDPVLRMRFTAWHGESAAVFLLTGVRMGSLPFLLSDDSMYPYTTGSLDLSFGVAFVDTVGAVAWWTSATGTYPTRVEDELKDSGLHGSYSTFSAGTRFPVAGKLDLQLGAAIIFPTDGSVRPVYFGGIDWQYTDVAGFYAYGQYEDQTEQEWSPDYTVGVGTKFNF